MSLVSNERIKYLATLINTVAAASVTVGVVAPLVALTYGVPGPLGSGFRADRARLVSRWGGPTSRRQTSPGKAAGMTLLHWYALVGGPLFLVAAASVAVFLAIRYDGEAGRKGR